MASSGTTLATLSYDFNAKKRDRWSTGMPSLILSPKSPFATCLASIPPVPLPLPLRLANISITLARMGIDKGVRRAMALTCSRCSEWRSMRRWYSVAGMSLNSSGNLSREGRWIGVVCDEATFISSPHPYLQAIAYALRGTVSINPVNDDRNRDRATWISYLSARTKASDKTVKSSTTNGVEEG